MATQAWRWQGSGGWRVVIAVVAMLCGIVQAASAPAVSASPVVPAPVAPAREAPAELRLMNRPIVTLRATVGGADPATRVARAQATFDALSETQLSLPLGRIAGSLGDVSGVAFRLGDRLLFALTVGDLDQAEGLAVDVAAAQVQARLQAAIDARRAQMYWPNLLRGALLSLAGLTLLVGLIWGIGRARNRMRTRLQQALDVHLKRRASGTFDWTGAVYQLVSRIVQILAVGSVFVLAFLWLQFAMEQFPLTEPLGDRMGVFIVGLLANIAISMVEAIPGLVTVVVILLITRAVQRLVANIFVAVQKGQVTVPGMHPETAGATRRVASVLIWVLGFTFAYPYIPGSQSDIFKGLSVLLGFMVTLGSANVVNQLMSGMVVVYSRALRRGDMVCIGDTVGTVAGLDALSVKVINLRNEEVTLPNAVVVGSAIHNYSRHGTARDARDAEQGALISATVTIGYDTPWRQVHGMLLEAAGQARHVVAEPTPFVLQRALQDFYVEYELFAAIDHPRNRFHALSALHAGIQDAFNAYGVQIMSPHFMDQPSHTIGVPEARWFEVPGNADIDPAAHARRSAGPAAGRVPDPAPAPEHGDGQSAT